MPTTRSGCLAAAAIAVTSSEEVLVASTQSAVTISSASRPNSSRLTLQPLRRGLDDQLRTGPGPRASLRAPSAAVACSAGSLVPAPALYASLELSTDRLQPALERLRHRVVEQRPRAGQARELRDPGAHRPGADHADDLGSARPSQDRNERVDPGQRAADDQLLDLRGPLVQRGHAHVAEVALDRMVVDVARAAVDLDRGVGAADRRLGGVQLGDRGLGRVRLAQCPSG